MIKIIFLLAVLSLKMIVVFSQNVGIGKENPLVRLDVFSTSNSPARFDAGSPMFIALNENGVYRGYIGSFSGAEPDVDFGTGFGNTTGKLHLTIQANPRLTIRENGYVGINNTNPQWQLDVEGGMRLNGRLFIEGTSGSAGQVLTSGGGVNKPSWQSLSTAFDNNVRFAVSINNTSTGGSPAISRSVLYNTNAAAVSTPTSGSIIINQPGLYHFEGNFTLRISFNDQTVANIMYATPRLIVGDDIYNTHYFNEFKKDGTSSGWTGKETAVWQKDIYIATVPTIVTYSYDWTYNPTNNPSFNSRVFSGIISGYKIAD